MYAPARQSYDWTVLHTDGEPQVACRGIEGGGETFATALITGYEPVLLSRQDSDGSTQLSPHNLISSWYWVYGESERPVPYRDLQAAWLDGEAYQPDILDVFDEDGDGQLGDTELVIDSDAKEMVVAARLEALGLQNPRIVGEIQPYNINHNVTHGEWATGDCQVCHSEDSRIGQPLLLTGQMPGGVMPTFVGNETTLLNGDLTITESGALYYEPDVEANNLYVLGNSSVNVVDWAGIVVFLGTLLGIVSHGGLRYFSARSSMPQEPDLKEVYMYGVYERLWHWLQTVAIVVLLFTGLIIHKPDMFSIFSFRYVVQVHNVVAFILVANAALSLFYHLASGEIRQYLPQPRGFFSQALTQTTFYLRGIFRGEEHPFEKTPQRKLNPLQQITYLGLLNVLLPGQIITGILMWGAQRWPQLTNQIGGLTYLGPIHSMISWLLASFVVMHVYLTTTGATPLANIKAMITGWDDVEVYSAAPGD
jgi:thiosulfate reductase cytochrome b subunit